MKRNIVLIAGITTVAALLTGTLSVTAYSRHAATTRVVRFNEIFTGVTYVPVQKLVGSKSLRNDGDAITFQDKLLDPNAGNDIGTIYGSCSVTDARTDTSYCSAVTVVLRGIGTISSDGVVQASGPTGPYGIFAGTGRFAGAVGTLRSLHNTPNTTNWELTYSK